MISHKLELIFNHAILNANKLKHEFLSLEAILVAMLDDQAIQEVLDYLHVENDLLKKELEEFLRNPEHFSILTEERISELSEKQFQD